ELLGTIGFVAFCSFYAAGGGKSGFIRSLAVNYSGMVWAFFAALSAGWLAPGIKDSNQKRPCQTTTAEKGTVVITLAQTPEIPLTGAS
uniref:DUF1097 domain-containing protein n=1 Tax=Enterobacter hormaechei TaxID=158836 RepID=UPI0020410ECC